MVWCTKSRSQRDCTYLNWGGASCHPNIGCRRQKTIIQGQKAQGWNNTMSFIIWIGGKPNTESWFPTIRWPMSQLCIPPLCCMPTMHSPPPLKPLKCPSSDGRRFSNSQGTVAPSTSPTLDLKSLYWKRTWTIGRMCQWVREPMQTTGGKDGKLTIASSRRGTIEGHPMRTTHLWPLTSDQGSQRRSTHGHQQPGRAHAHYCLGHLAFPKLKQLTLNARFQQSLLRCCLPSVQAAYSAWWQSFLGKARKPKPTTRSSLQPNLESVSWLTKWCQQKWDVMHNWKANSPRSATNAPPSSSTPIATSVLSTSNSTTSPT